MGIADNSLGWKVVLTHNVPDLTAATVDPLFHSLLEETYQRHNGDKYPEPVDFDWALHPGGSTVITGVQSRMGLTEDHLRASYDVYMKHGNSSSATIFSVMKRLREMGEGRENVVALAFGPGISVELMMFRRKRPEGPPSIGIPSEPVD